MPIGFINYKFFRLIKSIRLGFLLMKTKSTSRAKRSPSRSPASVRQPKLRPDEMSFDDEYEVDTSPKGLSPRLASWILLILGFGTIGMAACGPTDLRQALTDVRNQKVDEGVQVTDRDPKPLDPEDVAIMVKQAARVTGALSETLPSELQVDVRPGSEIDRPDDGRPPLDVRPRGLKDGPISEELKTEQAQIKADFNQPASPKSSTQKPAKSGGYVQIGTFSSKGRATDLAATARKKAIMSQCDLSH